MAANVRSDEGDNIYALGQRHEFQSGPRAQTTVVIDLEKYARLRPGTTIVKAVRVIGKSPKLLGVITGGRYPLVAYQWPEYKEKISVVFRSGKLVCGG